MTTCADEKSSPTFADVKAILDHLVSGKEDLVPLQHGEGLRWETAQDLRDAAVRRVVGGVPKRYPLIDPALVGQPGRGGETLFVRVLTATFELDGVHYPRMPKGGNVFGEHATSEQLAVLTRWVEAGCPD